mmetsp:Transcript_13347/g.20801  ORF Transcript_13347/g.20801 Transcript_13347/m.20801 type:complete len:507 (+) Transcript_13347:410-1930(+)
MRVNPCYQIDCVAASSGKMVAATKRRVRFRFGFSNREALAEGRKGVECRGSEHEVTFVWSLTSGKRLVLLDGKEVHFSKGKPLETTFETSWTFMPGHHQLKLQASATASEPQSQFNLFLDGMSFYQMPHMYQLGHAHGQPQFGHAQPLPQDESSWSRNVLAHEQRRSMRDAPPPSSSTSTAPSSAPTMDILSEPMLPPGNHSNPPQPQVVTGADHYSSDSALSTLGTMSSSSYDEFAPVMPAPPTMTDLHKDILGAYGTAPDTTNNNNTPTPNYTTMAPPPLAITAAVEGDVPHTLQDTNNISPLSNLSTPSNFSPSQQELREAPVVNQEQQQQPQYPALTMAPTTTTTTTATSSETSKASDVDRAVHNLVNLDDITQDAEFLKDPKLTMFQQQQQQKNKRTTTKSIPLAPSKGSWNLGPKPTLGDIKATSQKKEITKEIMKPHHNAFSQHAPQAGMLVVYGAATHDGSGPPPLASHNNTQGSVGMGFGVGATMMHPSQSQQYYAY